MFVGIRWIIKLMIDIYYGLFEIDVELCFIYILLVSNLRLFLCVLVVSPLHSITLAMWFGVTPRESSLERWLGSCLLMTSLSYRNMSLGNVPLPPRITKWFLWLCAAFIAMQSSVALSSWICRGSQLNTKGCMLDSPLFLRVLTVSPLYFITLAMWLSATTRESSLARWLGSCPRWLVWVTETWV